MDGLSERRERHARDLKLRGIDGKYLEGEVHVCEICATSWRGPVESIEAHERGNKHHRNVAGRSRCALPDEELRWDECTFDKDVEKFARQLCQVDDSRRCAEKGARLTKRMRVGSQSKQDFDDVEGLWGYATAKFPSRARLAFKAMRNCASLHQRMATDRLHVASFGGGPGAELLASEVARKLAGGKPPLLTVFEWVDSWRPIVDATAKLMERPIQYSLCDVTKPLNHELNAAVRSAAINVAIFSYVLLESSREDAVDALALLRDLWLERVDLTHVLVLDAGQARGGRSQRSGLLAGSLAQVEALAGQVGASTLRVEGTCKTEGLFLLRTPEPVTANRWSAFDDA